MTGTVLVAGGAGFIGSHLCERLLGDGHRVLCLDNLRTGRLVNLSAFARDPRFDFVEADVTNPLPPMPSGLEAIYNLACVSSPRHYQADPEHTMLTNVVGTAQLLRLSAGARFVLTSTSEVYGDPEVHPQPEDYAGRVNCTGPRACYDEGKRAAETLAFDADRAGRAEVRVARLFNTYGPRMRPDDGRVIPTAIGQALAGAPITIFGDGSQTRSFCQINDLVEGLVRLARHDGPQPGPVNLGNPEEVTITALVERIIALTGSRSSIRHEPLPVDDPKRRCPDISKARALLDWEPRIALDQGLAMTIAAL